MFCERRLAATVAGVWCIPSAMRIFCVFLHEVLRGKVARTTLDAAVPRDELPRTENRLVRLTQIIKLWKQVTVGLVRCCNERQRTSFPSVAWGVSAWTRSDTVMMGVTWASPAPGLSKSVCILKAPPKKRVGCCLGVDGSVVTYCGPSCRFAGWAG